MSREYTISGSGINPEMENIAREQIDRYRIEGRESYEDELEKTAEELKMIEAINGLLGKELESLGLDIKFSVTPEQIHLFTAEAFKKHFPEQDSPAFYRASPEDAIFINKEVYDELHLLGAMLHESIHAASHMKFNINVEARELGEYRVGYTVTKSKRDKQNFYFDALNEAVTTKIETNIIEYNEDKLTNELNIPSEQLGRGMNGYSPYIDIMEIIVYRIAEKNEEPGSEVWNRFKRGLFTGDLMHLRDVERTFGKGALTMLAALGQGNPEFSGDKNSQINIIGLKVLKYFQTNDEKQKELIAKEVLVSKELERHEHRRGYKKI